MASASSYEKSLGAGVVELEHPMLKVTFELVSQLFRTSQRSLEKELQQVSDAILALASPSGAASSSSSSSLNPAAIEATLDDLLVRVREIKAKMEDIKAKEAAYLRKINEKIQHLKLLQQLTTPDANRTPSEELMAKENLNSLLNMRLNRLLVDYLLRASRLETAKLLAKSAQIEMLVDTEVFETAKIVIDQLKQHNATEALRWCAENRSRLKKFDSILEFQLRAQEFIELVKSGEQLEAIAYARKYFANAAAASAEYMTMIKSAMASLAFPVDTDCEPYKSMFCESKWDALIEQFKRDNYLIHSLTTEPLLSINLHTGLAALKTVNCSDPATKHPNCPVCQEPFASLAKSLPRAQHSFSVLVCPITGKIMDEHNPPMALPNGHVYSAAIIRERASENDGVFVCKFTGEAYRVSECRKLFVL